MFKLRVLVLRSSIYTLYIYIYILHTGSNFMLRAGELWAVMQAWFEAELRVRALSARFDPRFIA